MPSLPKLRSARTLESGAIRSLHVVRIAGIFLDEHVQIRVLENLLTIGSILSDVGALVSKEPLSRILRRFWGLQESSQLLWKSIPSGLIGRLQGSANIEPRLQKDRHCRQLIP
jgi:hypothetical protein